MANAKVIEAELAAAAALINKTEVDVAKHANLFVKEGNDEESRIRSALPR